MSENSHVRVVDGLALARGQLLPLILDEQDVLVLEQLHHVPLHVAPGRPIVALELVTPARQLGMGKETVHVGLGG